MPIALREDRSQARMAQLPLEQTGYYKKKGIFLIWIFSGRTAAERRYPALEIGRRICSFPFLERA
jgi:hypothetical protein